MFLFLLVVELLILMLMLLWGVFIATTVAFLGGISSAVAVVSYLVVNVIMTAKFFAFLACQGLLLCVLFAAAAAVVIITFTFITLLLFLLFLMIPLELSQLLFGNCCYLHC